MDRTKRTSTKAARRRRMKSVALNHGVFAVFKDGKPKSVELRLPQKVRAMLGDRLMIGFVQAFNVAERFDSLLHLVKLNAEGVPQGSIAWARNLRLLAFLHYGALYEAIEAMQSLSGGGAKGVVGADYEPWRRLAAMLKRWEKDKILRLLRHQFGHHLGNPDVIKRGLDRLESGKKVVVFDTDGNGLRLDSSYPMALQVLLSGVAIEASDMVVVMNGAHDDYSVFGDLVQRLFWEVLRQKGVRLPSDDELDGGRAEGLRRPLASARGLALS
jgi:hypothetical protein